MIKQSSHKQSGFTLVETVLVLAIGGLILAGSLMAVANSAKLRNDGKRKAVASKALVDLQAWSSNNRGIVPSDTTTRDSFTDAFPDNLINPATGLRFDIKWNYRYTEDPLGNRTGTGGVIGELASNQLAILSPNGARTRNPIICVGTEVSGVYCTDKQTPQLADGEVFTNQGEPRSAAYNLRCRGSNSNYPAAGNILWYARDSCPPGTTPQGNDTYNLQVWSAPCPYVDDKGKTRYLYTNGPGACYGI